MLDNYDLWEKHDREMEEKLKKLPVCEMCGEPIQQEKAVHVDGKWYCEDCEFELWQSMREEFLENID